MASYTRSVSRWLKGGMGVLLIGVLAGAPVTGPLCGMLCAREGDTVASSARSPVDTHHHHTSAGVAQLDGDHAGPAQHESQLALHPLRTLECVSTRECAQLFGGTPAESSWRITFTPVSPVAEDDRQIVLESGGGASSYPTYGSPPIEAPAIRSVVLRI
jgi:hypothetical protein